MRDQFIASLNISNILSYIFNIVFFDQGLGSNHWLLIWMVADLNIFVKHYKVKKKKRNINMDELFTTRSITFI